MNLLEFDHDVAVVLADDFQRQEWALMTGVTPPPTQSPERERLEKMIKEVP